MLFTGFPRRNHGTLQQKRHNFWVGGGHPAYGVQRSRVVACHTVDRRAGFREKAHGLALAVAAGHVQRLVARNVAVFQHLVKKE